MKHKRTKQKEDGRRKDDTATKCREREREKERLLRDEQQTDGMMAAASYS